MDKIKLDGRLGFSLEVTPEELNVLTGADRTAAKELLINLVQSEQCTIVGDTYFPVEWNEEVLNYDMEENLSFDLPEISLVNGTALYVDYAEEVEDIDYKSAVDKAVKELNFVDKNNEIELYADYRDTGEYLLEKVYENRDDAELENVIRDEIWESYTDGISVHEDAVLDKAGVVGETFEEEAREYLRDTYSFVPPFDHFLSHEMKVNIMLTTPEERNCEYTNIHEQYIAMVDPDSLTQPGEALKDETSLSWLLKQQGHTMDELQATMKDYDKFFYADELPVEVLDENGNKKSLSDRIDIFNQNHNAFLTSVCQELENQTYDMGVMTVLAKMSIKDFIEMQKGGKDITMSKDCMIGIYNPWNGSGSVLDIELEKDLVFSTDMIRDVQIEGCKPQFEYTVDYTYGLIGSCWKEPKSIEDSKKPLDYVIQSCEKLSKNNNDSVEVSRDVGER